MKKFLKIVGVLFLGAIGIGLIWYFQSLKVEGDPLLTACWGVEVYDDLTGEKVVGVEDLDFDPESGTIFMSAYDRRAVAREIEAGKVTTQGGIYTINVSDITDAPTLKVTDISRAFKDAGNEFRPHGFALGYIADNVLLMAINRTYQEKDNLLILSPIFELFYFSNQSLMHMGNYTLEGVCDPNDLILVGILMTFGMTFSDNSWNCQSGVSNYKGAVKITGSPTPEIIIEDIVFPNGLAIAKKQNSPLLAVAVTREKSIQLFELNDYSMIKNISLKIAPDNLTVDQDDNLYVAGFPNLIDYYFYMKSWLGVEKSPSAAYRISPENFSQELLFKDDGSMISGATVALRASDYLILGSAWDDNIAICSGMDGLD